MFVDTQFDARNLGKFFPAQRVQICVKLENTGSNSRCPVDNVRGRKLSAALVLLESIKQT